MTDSASATDSDTDSDTDQRLELAREIAKSAGRLTLNYFQTGRFDVMKKGDGSPLTIADQEAEKYLRQVIVDTFPNDAIVGEEFGHRKGDSGFCWILDPIDGTKSFISGVPLYGTMVGVEKVADSTEENNVRSWTLGFMLPADKVHGRSRGSRSRFGHRFPVRET